MRSFKILLSWLPILLTASAMHGQGNFQNLDFESANVTGNSPALVPIANALPGWVGYIGNNQVTQIVYNTVSLGAAAITLQSSSSTIHPIAGNYSVFLQGQFNPNDVPGRASVAVAQSGQVPMAARSLLFWGSVDGSSGSLVPSFNGQIIPLVLLQPATNHLVWGGDISAFAGQTGELRFTALSGSTTGGYLDNISFSTNSVPEPSTVALTITGVFLFGCNRWRKRR